MNKKLIRLTEGDLQRVTDKWDKQIILNGLNLDLDEKISNLYEYNSMKCP
jgi:hypothetical protein